MISAEIWYETFEAYNADWLLVIVISWLALVVSTCLVYAKPSDRSNALMKACLAFIFAWNGFVFFFMYMTSSAIPGGIPMIAISVLFTVDIFRNKIEFRVPEERWQKYLTLLLIVWALGLYTIVGWLTGHPYPQGPVLVAPCPITIFAIALLSTVIPASKSDRYLFIVHIVLLLWWAFISGIVAPMQFGFSLDLTLLATGIYGLVMLIRNWRATQGPSKEE
ncbi:MAG: hypothetical protein KAU48_10575 [Candidatus Thorarchaeota archaeon]|nr:hypothetical protein [Candidatus Thorarchaeota archaeon]